jgi:hypothetical protein
VSDPALQLTVDVPILVEICARLGHIEARLSQLEADVSLSQEWYTLRQAARLKRGTEFRINPKTEEIQAFDSFYHTLRSNPGLRPGKGVPDGHQGGRPVWHRDTIREWLLLTDADLQAVRRAS